MTAPDEKAREIADEIAAEYSISRYGRSRIAGAITAALIEARRAALEEAAKREDAEAKFADQMEASTADLDFKVRWSVIAHEHRRSAICIRALIPTRPDGAAELFAENAKKEGGEK